MAKVKAPTKDQFRGLLEREIKSWNERINEYEGEAKEQAIGRKLECEWLLNVFTGSSPIG